MKKVYVGLDLGSSSFQQAALNQEGAIIMKRTFPTSEVNLRSAFANLRIDQRIDLRIHIIEPR